MVTPCHVDKRYCKLHVCVGGGGGGGGGGTPPKLLAPSSDPAASSAASEGYETFQTSVNLLEISSDEYH